MILPTALVLGEERVVARHRIDHVHAELFGISSASSSWSRSG